MKTIKTSLFLQNLHAVDARAFRWCNTRKHRDQLAMMALWVSGTADGPLYVLAGLFLAVFGGSTGRLFFDGQGSPNAAMTGCHGAVACGLLAYALDVPLYLLLKFHIKRERPFRRLPTKHDVEPADRFSFPSGHTAGAFVWATLTLAFFPAYAPLALGWATLVGTSRVLLGVHYPGYTLAGMVLGSSCAGFALSVLA